MKDYKFIANLGDVNFLEHGGFLVYQSKTNPLDVRIRVIEPGESEGDDITEYEFPADQCYHCDDGENVSDNEFHKNHPAWFSKDLESVASYCGSTKSEIIERLCSEYPIDRSLGYRDIVAYLGIHEFDQYPLTLTQTEAEKRYSDEITSSR